MESEKVKPVKITMAQRNRMRGLINDLESGKFNQVRGTLRLTDKSGKLVGNCCLGIAAQRLVDAGICSWGRQESNNITDFEELKNYFRHTLHVKNSSYTSAAIIPSEVEEYFGFKANSLDPRQRQDIYWQMNDKEGKSFVEIAAELRRNFGFPTKEEENAKKASRKAKN